MKRIVPEHPVKAGEISTCVAGVIARGAELRRFKGVRIVNRGDAGFVIVNALVGQRLQIPHGAAFGRRECPLTASCDWLFDECVPALQMSFQVRNDTDSTKQLAFEIHDADEPRE